MPLRPCISLLLLLLACATTEPSPREPAALSPRVANLQRAAALPWADGGRCVVQEASNEWPVLVERCFHALDHDRIEFRDTTGRCAVASSSAAAVGMGICILVAPEIIVGAVIITGAVVVAVTIKEELDEYEREASRERARPSNQTQPTKESMANRKPKPEGSSSEDIFPPLPTQPRLRRPECEPVPGPSRGGNDPHNECADKVPKNAFPGLNVFVNGKHFDALDLGTRTLWEVKTDDFDKHSRRSQEFFARVKLPELQREDRLAKQCGYNFIVGVRSPAHKAVLFKLDPNLKVIVMDWC